MTEFINPFIEAPKKPIRYDLDMVTDGVDRHVVVAGTGLFVQQNNIIRPALLSPDCLNLAIKLFAEPDKPFLSTELANRQYSAPARIANLTEELCYVGLDGHIAKVGRRYGALTNNKDSSLFSKRGIESVIESERHPLARSRGVEAFKAFEALCAGQQKDRFRKKRVLGTAAAVLSIGGVITYAVIRHNSQESS